MGVATNAHGEIVNVQEADQFQIGKSQFCCGFFTCAILRSMVQPGTGKTPTLNEQQVITNALAWYAQYDGTPAITNTNGMTLEQLYELLQQIGLHFQATSPDATTARGWLQAGYPLAAAVYETSVYDLALGDTNPYPWKPAGTHIIALTGVAANGNLLIRDSANCTNLYNPNTLRPGPRTYDAAKLQFVSLTVVVPPWMPRPASTVPPAFAPVQADPSLKIPDGWSDDGSTLTAPNGGQAVLGFRHYILTHAWDAADMPIGKEESVNPIEIGYTPADGDTKGARLICMYTELGYTPKRGVYKISVGRELATALAQLKAQTPASAQGNVS
jgi:hypothetical protein